LPLNKNFDSFNLDVNSVKRGRVCGSGKRKGYRIQNIILNEERGWGLYGELKESFEFLVLKPATRRARILDSVERELPDKYKYAVREGVVDIDSDGRADLLQFRRCCRKQANPDSVTCNSCTEAFQVRGDSLKATYYSTTC
jgi:hypothetical protein